MKLLFKFRRWLNDGIPSPYEVDYCLSTLIKANGMHNSIELVYIMDCYACGDSISEISEDMQISQEDVLAILFRGCKIINGF